MIHGGGGYNGQIAYIVNGSISDSWTCRPSSSSTTLITISDTTVTISSYSTSTNGYVGLFSIS